MSSDSQENVTDSISDELWNLFIEIFSKQSESVREEVLEIARASANRAGRYLNGPIY